MLQDITRMSDVFAYEITGPGSDLFGIIDLTEVDPIVRTI